MISRNAFVVMMIRMFTFVTYFEIVSVNTNLCCIFPVFCICGIFKCFFNYW